MAVVKLQRQIRLLTGLFGRLGHDMTNLPTMFAESVCRSFGLGQPTDGSQIGSGANVVWRLVTSTGDYVVKELPAQGLRALTEAAAFEYAVWMAHILPMPEPRPDRDGALVSVLPGSRGRTTAVRVHRHVTGQPVGKDQMFATKAGHAVAAIQNFGAIRVHNRHTKQLWSGTDRGLLDRFRQRWPDLDISRAEHVLGEAERIIQTGGPQALVFSHADHKPENCLADGNVLLTLDWDEAGVCQPRPEAVESALRWSWTACGEPDPLVFASFVDGYRAAGRPFQAVREADWAKWTAGLASWFGFKARCSLGEWPEVAADPWAEALSALQALEGLDTTLRRIPEWTATVNAAIR